jgi:hypothetical protein
MRSKELEVPTVAPSGPVLCSANGCPMAGTYGRHTITTSTPSWWCGFHTETDPKFTHEITRLVRQNLDFIRAAYSIMVIPVSQHQQNILRQFSDAMIDAGRPEFAPKEDETPFALGYRIIRQLQSEISADKREQPKTETGEDQDVVYLGNILSSLRFGGAR